MTTEEIRDRLFKIKDDGYKAFHSKLIPTVNPDKIIGVRTPDLRKFTSEIYKSGEYERFLEVLPHEYYEENNLHGFIIEKFTDFDKTIEELDRFLPYVDNWATCDMISPKTFKKKPPELLPKIKEWINSGNTYAVRFGINTLMKFYLDEKFSPEYPNIVADLKSDEYYVNMAAAWYFATALSKRYGEIVPYIENKKLSVWVHNKTIRKAVESYRITPEQKKYLRTLIIK